MITVIMKRNFANKTDKIINGKTGEGPVLRRCLNSIQAIAKMQVFLS